MDLFEESRLKNPLRKAGCPLYRRAYPRFVRLRELLTSSQLGAITAVRLQLQPK